MGDWSVMTKERRTKELYEEGGMGCMVWYGDIGLGVICVSARPEVRWERRAGYGDMRRTRRDRYTIHMTQEEGVIVVQYCARNTGRTNTSERKEAERHVQGKKSHLQ